MKLNRYGILILFLPIFLLLTGCRIDVPIKEMVKAKRAITRAVEVKADTYDPDNLDQAKSYLLKSHDYLKKPDVKKSKEAAKKAYEFAQKAINTSLPLLAKDTYDQAKGLYKEADALYAEKFAVEEFTEAGRLIEEAEALLASESFWESYLKSKKALGLAEEAKNKAINKIPSLKSEIEALQKESQELAQIDVNGIITNDLTAAGDKLKDADNKLAGNKIKEATVAIGEASEILKNARKKVLQQQARQRIKELRAELEELKQQPWASHVSEDIEVTASKLNEADAALDQENIEEAIKKITEAEDALAIAREKSLKARAADKIASVEKLLQKVEDENKDRADKIAQARSLLDEAKQLYETASYEDSIKKADESEAILNSLSVAKEKDLIGKDGLKGDDETLQGATFYVVIYNKDKRDCLWRIAEKVYKDASLWPLIYVANKDKIKDPDLIYPGQRFVIPPLRRGNVPSKEEAAPDDSKDVITKDEDTKETTLREDEATTTEDKSKNIIDDDKEVEETIDENTDSEETSTDETLNEEARSDEDSDGENIGEDSNDGESE